MPGGNHPPRPERGGDRRPTTLPPAPAIPSATGQRRAIPGDDGDLRRRAQRRRRRPHRARIRHRPVRRRHPATQFGQRRIRAAGLDEFPHQSVEIEMHRPRRHRDRGRPGLAELPWQVGRLMHLRRMLRHRGEQRRMRHFLIGVAVLMADRLVPGQRQHRAAAEIRILQPGGEIGRADRLRRHHAGPAGDPAIGIRHVDGGLFGMRQHRLHADPFQLQQGPPQHRIDEEEMRLAGGLQAARQPLRPVHDSGSAPLMPSASSTRETQL